MLPRVLPVIVTASCAFTFDPSLLDGGVDASVAEQLDGGAVDAGPSLLEIVGSLQVRGTTAPPAFVPPTGSREGDLLITLWTTDPAHAPPPGWSELGRTPIGQSGGTEGTSWLGFHVLDAGEPTSTFRFPGGTSTYWGAVVVVAVRGAARANPIDQATFTRAFVDAQGGNTLVHRTPSITTSSRRSLGFSLLSVTQVTAFPPRFADAGVRLERASGTMVVYTTDVVEPRTVIPRLSVEVSSVDNNPDLQWAGVGAFNVTE